jgi:hypothetical protein
MPHLHVIKPYEVVSCHDDRHENYPTKRKLSKPPHRLPASVWFLLFWCGSRGSPAIVQPIVPFFSVATGLRIPAFRNACAQIRPLVRPAQRPAPRGPQLDPGPQHQWDDWKWQQQNAIRSVSQLRHLLPFTRDELEAIGKLETEYKLMIQCIRQHSEIKDV